MDCNDSPPRYRPAADIRRHWAVFAGLVVGLAIWCLVDVSRRAAIDPAKPWLHMTDLTVYTEAGAAFFDGREPYEVSNIRGWKYLYPPLFALLMAPLHHVSPPLQAAVWFGLSALMGIGCYFECRRIFDAALQSHSPRETTNPDAPSRASRAAAYLFASALAATAFPALNCLQRGQMGVALLYFLLLGFRLTLLGRSGWQWLLGGATLALPVALKLTPALPAVVVAAVLILRALLPERFQNREREHPRSIAWPQFACCSLGLAAGCVLFFLLIPAALIGWRANLTHLRTWHEKVASRFDDVRGIDFGENVTSLRNQSLQNAAFRAGNWTACQFFRGPDDRNFDPTQGAMPMDSTLASQMVLGGRALALLALGVVILFAAARRDLLMVASAFGLACVATLVVSPVSRGHYFVFWVPAVVSVPLWLLHCGRVRMAHTIAAVPALLTIAHYAALEHTGRVGLLGLGMTAWYFAACALICCYAPEACVNSMALPEAPAATRPRRAA